jgi:hypothetical protein
LPLLIINAISISFDINSEFINTINWYSILTFTGGLTLSHNEEKNKKSSIFTCPNLSCGKVFDKPLQALNLQQSADGPYDACPYCLTEITLDAEPNIDTDESENLEMGEATADTEFQDAFPAETQDEIQDEIPAEPEIEEPVNMQKQVETSESPSSSCLHHLGYLSEKSSNEQIPDECMMCKEIVTCMLKKMKE